MIKPKVQKALLKKDSKSMRYVAIVIPNPELPNEKLIEIEIKIHDYSNLTNKEDPVMPMTTGAMPKMLQGGKGGMKTKKPKGGKKGKKGC
jgi:hypothetical protein